MTIGDKIRELIQRNGEVLQFLNHRGRDYEKADEVIIDYLEKFEEWDFDSGLTNDFANCLQLSSNADNFRQYHLEDIRELLQSSLKLQEYNLDTYVDLGHFEFAVMNHGDNAEKIVDEGILKAKEKIDELTRLKTSIRNKK